jgi:hypothetical protein
MPPPRITRMNYETPSRAHLQGSVYNNSKLSQSGVMKLYGCCLLLLCCYAGKYTLTLGPHTHAPMHAIGPVMAANSSRIQ